MRRIRLRALAALAIGGWLTVSAAPGTQPQARAADRPAEQILAEIDAVEVPKSDPDQRGDTVAMTEFLAKRKAALAKRGTLIFELFHAHPEHPKLSPLFSARWQDQLMTSSGPQQLPRLGAELDEVLAQAKNPKLKADAAFFRTILQIQEQGTLDEVLKTIDKFIALAPKDERGAMLLNSIAGELGGTPRQPELLRRVVDGYPESPYSESAKRTLRRLESVGKPIELEFTDAIKGKPVSLKNLQGKVIVIDFWATWCGPCVAEMPNLKALYAKYHDQGVEFLGVSLDQSKEEGGLDSLKEFVSRNEIPWPQYYQGKGWEGEFSSSWGIDSIPAMFVVDQGGKLVSVDAVGHLDEILTDLLKKGSTAR
jgi:thiol-disulfide isomerase/thioredoxin